jgi:2-keto-4-pentenoate hydratase/2-oxohepta-3-ene-1,7-dioic acid hydratase in catechol pathway
VLGVWSEDSPGVNGEPRQDSRTADMVHDTPRRVEDLASVMTLEPGDVIATGAPAGTASAARRLPTCAPGTSCGRRPTASARPGDADRGAGGGGDVSVVTGLADLELRTGDVERLPAY